MKKFSLFLMAMLISVMGFAADVTMAAGENGSACTVNGTDGIKVGTSKKGGDMTITVPGGATELSFYAAAWKGVTGLSINITPTDNVLTSSIALTDDAGLSNNPPFTLSGNEADYLHTITLQNVEQETTFKLTGSTTKRFVVWGATCTVGSSADFVAAPSIAGDVDFVESTTISITALDGLAIYYTVDGTDPTNESAAYTAPFEVTETTTVKAIAYNGDNASAIAEKTFKKLQVLTCADAAALCSATETTEKYVVRGYVTQLVNGGYSESYKNSSFWMADTKDGGKVLEAYAVDPILESDIQVKVGDYVEVIGKLVLYGSYNTPEVNRGTYTIIPEPAPVYTVTVTAENGTVEGAGEYIENAEVTLTATPAEGYEFVNWTVADSIVSTENPYTFNVTANVALVANFKAVVVEEPLPEGVPTNAELWEAFKPYYNTYYGLTRADQPIDKVSTFAAAKMQEIMTDAASEYKWLGDYVLGVAAGQGVNLPTDMAAANEGAWRWAVHAFFNATTGANGAAGTDFTEAGKPQVWGPYYLAAQKPAEGPVEIVGVVKRALQAGETTIILTHEANGTPHIYTVAGKTIAEVSQEGVVAKDTANAGDYLTISDIALTEDGKLVACNYVRNQFEDKNVDAGYKRGTLHLYVWHDIKGAASIWFESMFTGNSVRGDCGYTMAVNGTVANANILVTAVHNSHRGVRMSHYTVIDSAYVEPNYANQTFNNHLFYVGAKFKGASAGSDAATFNEATHGVNYQLNASPLAENNWVMDSEGLMPTEFGVAAQQDPSITGAVAETLVSKTLVGAYYVTVGDKKVMVAPYADAEGKLAGVKLLDITAGFANAALLTTAESLDLTAPVAATGVATTAVVESNGTLTINLIADATIHTMTATIQESPSTNLENNNVQNDIIKFYQNGQIYIMINGAVYNVMGQMVK